MTIDAALAVLYSLTDQDTTKTTLPPLITEDISPDGLFLRTTKPLAVGETVALRLHLPTLTRPFQCQSKVMRVARRPNGEIRGVGVQFIGLSDEQRGVLVEHLYRSYQTQHGQD